MCREAGRTAGGGWGWNVVTGDGKLKHPWGQGRAIIQEACVASTRCDNGLLMLRLKCVIWTRDCLKVGE